MPAPPPPVDKQFKPGESGNPNGRPAGARNRSTIIRELLERINTDGQTNLEKINAAALLQALNGNITAWEKLMDSAFGKVADKTQLSGDPDAPPAFSFMVNRVAANPPEST